MKYLVSFYLFVFLLILFFGFSVTITNCSVEGTIKSCSDTELNFLFLLIAVCSILFMMGVYVLSWSPLILELDRDKDTCIRKTKHLWQKQYKTKTICKLSEIANAERYSLLGYHGAYLKLRTSKKILILWRWDILRTRYGCTTGQRNVDTIVKEVNHFLYHSADKNDTIISSLFEIGMMFIAKMSMAPFFFALVYMISNH